MAYKFHYQNNARQESAGEEISLSSPPEFKSQLDDLVKYSSNITIVGWREDTGTYTIQSMINDKKKINLIEIYKPNCDKIAQSIDSELLKIFNIDVQDFDSFIPLDERELLIWQDGPEHLPIDKSVRLINTMKKTYSKIIIATPKGVFEQGSLYGNEAECHLSSWEIEDYKNIGFNVSVISDNFLIGYWTKS